MRYEEIWRKPIYLPYLQPALTAVNLSKAEAMIGAPLPKEYVELLKIQNGGYISYTLEELPHNQIWGIGPYYPSLEVDPDWDTYVDAEIGFELQGLFPFDGDGHWYLCFDYRGGRDVPRITYVDTECNVEDIIAPTFLEYLSLLKIGNDGDLYVIDTDKSLTDVLSEVASLLDVEFDEPDWNAHGYPMYRAKWQDSWIWISPNQVPNGFVRKTDKRYKELQHLTKTNSLRFWAVPESAILLQAAKESVRNEIVKMMEVHSYHVKPLLFFYPEN